MNITITINIDWMKVQEKTVELNTIHKVKPSIQYNPINIKRIYYKKSDPQYHRKTYKPLCIKPISKTLISDMIVKQEPLLDLDF